MVNMNLSVIVAVICLALEVTAQDKRRHRTKSKAMGGNLGANRNMDSTTDSGLGSRRQQTAFRIWTLHTYPNPQKQPRRCGRPGYQSFLCDPDGILSPSEADDLDSKLNKICEETRCACQSCESPWFQHHDEECHGYKIAIAIMADMNYTDTNDLDNEGQTWTSYLREKAWKFGMCGDDVIILLVASLRKIFTSVGHKAGEILTPQCIDKGVADAKRHIQHSHYLTGLNDMIHLYGRVLKSENDNLCKAEDGKPLHPAAIAVIALFSAFTVIIVIGAICCVWGTCKKDDAGDTKRTNCLTDDNRLEGDAKLTCEPSLGPPDSSRLRAVDVPLQRSNSDSDDDLGETLSESYPMNRTRETIYSAAHAPLKGAVVKYPDDTIADDQIITSLAETDCERRRKSNNYNNINR